MSLLCFLCPFETCHIKELCTHLHNTHLLFDSLKLNLKCCAGCPASFKTFNGFKKHLKKCYVNQKIVDNLEENTVSCDNFFMSQTDNDESVEGIQTDDNNIHCDKNLIIEKNVSSYVSKLYSFGLAETTITSILESTAELIFPILDELVNSSQFEQRKNLADQLKHPLENQVTKYRRDKIMQEAIVQPVKKAHGIRMDQVYDKISQHYKTVPVTSTFTYIPLLETLRNVLNNKSVQNFFMNKPKKNATAYTHFIDGEVFETNSFYSNNDNAIQIELYYDEWEPCNPLGSKKTLHKIGAFYFTINNFPIHINSSLENIHILALCYDMDIKDFGVNPVLDVIVEDLKKLEYEGIFIESMNRNFRGTLSALSFDNLGGAKLLGMNESFQANFYCRICIMSKNDARVTCEADDRLLRTSESFNQYSNQQQYANSETMINFGIKHKSALFNLDHFDLCDNYTVDVMHDFLEGICQRDMKLFFEFCVKSQILDVTELNNRVRAFDYGLYNRANLPSYIDIKKKSNSIGQRAAQTHCLLIHLPLIVEDLIPLIDSDDYNKWKVILLLIEILKIVIAPKIPHNLLYNLSQLIKEHHQLLINECKVDLIAKDHLATHYPLIIRKMGPPRSYWTMRFESKNGYLKDLNRKLKNYKDLAYTLAVRHQKAMLSLWDHDFDLFSNAPLLKNFRSQNVASTNFEEIITTNLKISNSTIIYIGKSVQLRGATLVLNKFICTSLCNDLPVFCKTLLFFSYNNESYSICQAFKTIKISSSCLGYVIEKSAEIYIVKISDLPHTKAWDIHEFSADCVIITDYFL